MLVSPLPSLIILTSLVCNEFGVRADGLQEQHAARSPPSGHQPRVCVCVCARVCVQSPGWAALTPAPTLPRDSVFPACLALNYSSSHVSSALSWSMPGSEDPAGLGEGPVLMGTHPSVCPDDLLPWTG